MSIKRNVFVFPCGSEIGLEIGKALSYSTHFHLIGGGSVPDHGAYQFSDYIGELPLLGEQSLLPALQRVIEERAVDFVFPAHDEAVVLFSRWMEEGALGRARVVSAPYETCRIARSKSETYSRLRHVVPTPEIYANARQVRTYPVFLKPDVGQGSKGTFKATSAADVEYHTGRDPSMLILEYLPGREYTVDCFTDRHGRLRYAEGRERGRIMNGISVSTAKVRDTRFAELAAGINGVLRFAGAWFFQVKERANGEFVLMEIAARIAGTSCYHRIMGVNLPLLSLFDAMGMDVDVFENRVGLAMDRQLRNRYRMDYHFDAVYVDLDDTLFQEGRVNHLMVAALYKLKADGKRLFLITRHLARFGEEGRAFLKTAALDERLFDEVIEVPRSARKSEFISVLPAVFIDDSFAERKDVAAHAGVPVFDVNQAVEVFV